MISAIFEWAWRCGLDVRMGSKNWYLPNAEPTRLQPREASDFVQIDRTVSEHPVLVFSRGLKSISVEARNWAEMRAQLEHRQEYIFQELCCPALIEFTQEPLR